MSDGTHIAWTNATWNVFVGCTKKSKGCRNCSAIRDANRLSYNPHPKIAKKYEGTVTADGKNWTGRINFDEDTLLLPLRWRKPRMIFVNYTSDTFHANVPDEWIDRLFAVMALCPQHTFQLLTKRIDRARDYLNDPERADAVGQAAYDGHGRVFTGDPACPSEDFRFLEWPLPNVQLVTSIEDQETADERIPYLLQAAAAVRGVSMEPLISPVDLTDINPARDETPDRLDALRGIVRTSYPTEPTMPRLDWVIVGGESGSGARPMHPDWARSLRDQCAAAGVPFFFKQFGEWYPFGAPYITGDKAEVGAKDWSLRRLTFADGREEVGHFEKMCFDSDKPTFQEMYRIGKKRAGRLLDGREHSEFPSPA